VSSSWKEEDEAPEQIAASGLHPKWQPWGERAAELERRQHAFDEQQEQERAAVLAALSCASSVIEEGMDVTIVRGLCRRELRDATGLDYRAINEALDRLIVESLVVRLPDRNLVEYYATRA
jgi:DNA-binding MarR family transcriptional regulator